MKKMNTEIFLILIVIGLIAGAFGGMLGIRGETDPVKPSI